MTTDSLTANRGYQLPHGDNPLSHDVLRLIAALETIDVDVASVLVSLSLKAALDHTHPQSEVTGLETVLTNLQAGLASKPDLADIGLSQLNNVTLTSPSQGQLLVRGASQWNNASPNASLITQGQFTEARMPTYLQSAQLQVTYALASHTHAISAVTGLQGALDGKSAVSHTHAISDVGGLQDALNGSGQDVWFYGHVHGELDSSFIFGSETTDWTVMLHAPFAMTLNDIHVRSLSGSGFSVQVRINGVDVTGMGGGVTTSKQTFTATGANSVAAGDEVTFGLTSIDTADEHFSWAIRGTVT